MRVYRSPKTGRPVTRQLAHARVDVVVGARAAFSFGAPTGSRPSSTSGAGPPGQRRGHHRRPDLHGADDGAGQDRFAGDRAGRRRSASASDAGRLMTAVGGANGLLPRGWRAGGARQAVRQQAGEGAEDLRVRVGRLPGGGLGRRVGGSSAYASIASIPPMAAAITVGSPAGRSRGLGGPGLGRAVHVGVHRHEHDPSEPRRPGLSGATAHCPQTWPRSRGLRSTQNSLPSGSAGHPARSVRLPVILDQGGADAEQALYLLVAGLVGGPQVEVHPVLDHLALGHRDEQQAEALAGDDPALRVIGVVRVVGSSEPVTSLQNWVWR